MAALLGSYNTVRETDSFRCRLPVSWPELVADIRIPKDSEPATRSIKWQLGCDRCEHSMSRRRLP